ncbi:hypothetical protein B0H11DRAFT_2429026 [Mycena galericulata]|nr:hypothetical protein B0H11DRAFT_2429026 [Mycena galericulata]
MLAVEEGTKGGTGKKGKKSTKNSTTPADDDVVPALKEHEVMKKIEKKHYCQECKTACFVLDNGDHHILSHTELATWALLAVERHEAIIDEPPKDLGINANHGQQKKARNHRAKADENSNDAPPVWVQNLMPVLGALLGRGPAPVAAPAPATPDPRTTLPNPNPSPLSLPSKRAAEDIPSAEICPDITDWLARLDCDPVRSRLTDLVKVSADKLLELSGAWGLTWGVANRLVTYAKEDSELFSGQDSKRTKVD